MSENSKHRQIVLDYVDNTNIEIIIRNSIRSLIQANAVPDNPFGAMFRHFSYFSAKEDMRKTQDSVKGLDLNDLEKPKQFFITSSKTQSECYGLPHLLHYVNLDHFKVLYKSLKELCVDHKGKYEVTDGNFLLFEVRTSIGGGEILKSARCPNPEVASTPLEIRAECLVESANFDQAFKFFSDYVYEDIMKIGSNNALNIVRDFSIELGAGSKQIRRLNMQDIKRNKQLLVTELKNAALQKRNSYFRVLVFSQDLERFSSRDLIRAVTPSRLLSLTEPSVNDHFQFISCKKYYVLHHNSPRSPETKSLSPVPCVSLFSAVFPNPDSASNYAKVFYEESSNPYELDILQAFYQNKREKIIKFYKNGKIHKMAWEILQLAMTSKDHLANSGVINEIFSLFSHPSSKIFRVIRECKALSLLVDAFYDTDFQHFKKLAEGLFVRMKGNCWSVFGNPSTAEMILLKPLIVKMMNHISINNSRTLSLNPMTLRVLERLAKTSSAVARCTFDLLLRVLPLVSDSLSRLLISAGVPQAETFSQFTSGKQTDFSFNISDELKARNMRKDNEYLIVFEYLVKTQVMQVLIQTTRELVLSYPLVPNPLKTYAADLLYALFRHDMFQQSTNEVIETHMHLPNEVSAGVFVHASPDNQYSLPDLPYVVGSNEFLLVCSREEIGFFKTIFSRYELNVELFASTRPRGYTLEAITAICGTSVVNFEALSKFPSLWTVYYDIPVTGPNFAAGSHAFLQILVQYALWLDNDTDATVVGFFSPFASQPLAGFEDLIATEDRDQTIGQLLATFQKGSKIWLRVLLPYRGDQSSQVVGIPIAVHIYFNMYFRISFNRKVTSLIDPNSLEDLVKVFYSREDFELWKELNPKDQNIAEKLQDEFNSSINSGKHYRATVALLFLRLSQKNKEVVARLLRVKETPIKSIIECERFAKNLIDYCEAANQGHRKKDNEMIAEYGGKFIKFLEATFLQERNVFLENSQMNVLRVGNKFLADVRNPNGPKYARALESLKFIHDHLTTAKTLASLSMQDVLDNLEQFVGAETI